MAPEAPNRRKPRVALGCSWRWEGRQAGLLAETPPSWGGGVPACRQRINVVSPGIIATPMFGAESPARADMLRGATASNLIPRAGEAEEVARAVVFLALNKFVTGTTIDVDGGWMAGPAWP